MSFIQSCVQPAYVSNRLQAPLFRKAHEVTVTVSANVDDAVEFQLAYSPINHVALMGAYQRAKHDVADSNFYKEDLWEAGVGMYDTLGPMRYGIFAGYAQGKNHSEYVYTPFAIDGVFPTTYHQTDASFSRYSVLGNVGLLLSEEAEIAFALRVSDVEMHKYQEVRTELPSDLAPQGGIPDTLHGPFRHYFVEPAFIVRGGGTNLKLEFQISFIRPTVEVPYIISEGNISFGLFAYFDASKWFE